MSFPADSAPYYLVGPLGDVAALTAIQPGAVIGGGSSDESVKLVANAHRNYTNGNRVRVVCWTGQSSGAAGLASPIYSTPSLASVLAAAFPASAGTGRDWTVYADASDADVTVTVYDAGGAVLAAAVLTAAAGRDPTLTAPLTPVAGAAYVEVEVNALGGGPDAELYALRIYEVAATT